MRVRLVWSLPCVRTAHTCRCDHLARRAGPGPNGHQYLIEIIQGHRRWLALSDEPQHISHVMGAVVDDLDKRVRTTIDYRRRAYYVEKPFPTDVGDQVNPHLVGDFKPTGKFRKIAGYSCEEYQGTGDTARWGYETDVHCVSKRCARSKGIHRIYESYEPAIRGCRVCRWFLREQLSRLRVSTRDKWHHINE